MVLNSDDNSGHLCKDARMTYSILAYDQKTGTYAGAAAAGNLCVGGWVLRGDPESGLSASQGASPSTLWGTGVLDLTRSGRTASGAVETVIRADEGRPHRQLAALARDGSVAAFTGHDNVPCAGSVSGSHVIVAGNTLASEAVLTAVLERFQTTEGEMPARLMAALVAGQEAGGDSRGLLSAALLVVSRHAAPLSLRIDHSDDPLTALAALYDRTQADPYRSWARLVPTLDQPHRAGSVAENGEAGDGGKTIGGL